MKTTNTNSTGTNVASVHVPMPLRGDNLAVDMIPGNAVQLPFNPESADASRAGNDLVFEMEDGGSVTVNNFFIVEDGGDLPTLILPDGVEVASAEVFDASVMDLTTAAGGQSNSTTGDSGSGDYSDDAGALIGGIGRLGALGTFYWNRSTEVSEEYKSIEFPGGEFSLNGQTDLGDLLGMSGSVYEDGRPFQNTGDNTFLPGQLVFNFKPTGSTVVDAIHLSGFPAGTIIYLGDPNDPDTPTITVTGPDQVIDFTEGDFANGVYLTPPADCDKDFTINVEVDIHSKNSGLSTTINGQTTITVDAVADKPELDDYNASADSSDHNVVHETEEYSYDQGTNKVENSAEEGTATGGATVTITVKATFGDYTDGSERHFVVVETHDHLTPDLDNLPDGCTYVGTIIIDGVEYHQFEVDNSYIADNNGTVELPIDFKTTDDAGQSSGKDEEFDLKVGAYVEDEASDREIDLDNNTAHMVTEDGENANVSVDVVNRGLEVNVGWASEGGNDSKHITGNYTPNANDLAAMDGGDGVSADSTNDGDAPVNFRLSGDHEGSEEFITSVELQFDEGRGQLCVNGEPVTDGYTYTENGVTYTFTIGDDGKITIGVDGHTDNLDDLNMTFRPNPGYDDSDVNMSYNVNVENGAGATAEYGGKTEIVIDAVADKAIHGKTTVDYGQNDDGGDKTAASPGDTVELTYDVRFPDNDGSEEHRFFVRVDGNNGSATHNYGDHLVSGDRLAELNGLGGGFNPKGEYLELPIPHPSLFDENNSWVDPETGLVVHYENGTYTYEGLDITVTDNGNGNYTVKGVEVTLPDEATLTDGNKGNGELNPDTGDTSMNFESKGWSHENGGDKGSSNANNEHDTKNNDAFSTGNGKVDIATPGGKADDFTLSGGSGFENDEAHNNRPGTTNQDADGNDNTASGGIGLSITWDFADSNEYVTEIVITVPLDRYGNPVGEIEYNGETYSADGDGNIRIPVDPSDSHKGFDEGDLTFIPKGNESGKVDLDVSITVKDPDTGDTKTVNVTGDDKKLTVDLDAVANRSGEVSGEASYGDNKNAFAPEEGDSINFKVKTTFDDNDGSEQHFLLVEKKPHWEGKFSEGDYAPDPDGDKTTYFKIPVPTAPPEGAGDDYAGDAHHLSAQEWQDLLDSENGSITVERDGYTVTIQLQKNDDGEYDESLPWEVEAEFPLKPPYLPENDPDSSYTLGTGSLAEERDIDQSTEDRNENNNTAMRPGADISFDVDRTEGIKVDTGFVYENNEQYEGPGNGQDYTANGAINISPSSPADSFYGDLEVSIPSGHGDLYYTDSEGNSIKLEPGNSYDYTAKGGVDGQLVVTEDDGELIVTFKPNDPNAEYDGIDLEVGLSGDYSDKDIDVSVEGNLVNGNSGQKTPGVTGEGTVTNDAVAQNPDEVINNVEDGTIADSVNGTGAKVTLTAQFKDVTDSSESHFFLLEAKPGFSYTFTDSEGNEYTIDVTGDWPTVVGPDGKTYFKIPADPDENGDARLDVEIKVADGANEVVHKNGDGDDATFGYGTMTSEENRTPDGEVTYDNNIAFNDGNEFTIDVNIPDGSRPVDVDVAFENNTPNAHVGEDGEDSESYAQVHLPDDADYVLLNPERGEMVRWDEELGEYVELDKDENGWYIAYPGQDGDIYFKLPKDYDDSDVHLDYEVHGGNHDGSKGSMDIVVDAVAQQGHVDNVIVDTGTDENGNSYPNAGGGDISLKVGLSGLHDPHTDSSPGGHTDYFVLVEAQPGWECQNEGAELVIIDGKSYFKVPVDPDAINDDGTAEVEVILKNPGGTGSQDLDIGVMVQDRPGDNGETTMDNNTSINFADDPVTINTSEAEPNLKLSVGNGYEDNMGGYANIEVSNVGEDDVVTEMTFSTDSSEGVFTWGQGEDQRGLQAGDSFEEGNLVITVTENDGRWTVTITSKDGNGISEQDLNDYLNNNFGVGTADGNHSSKDIDIQWDYTVKDTQSGHTAGNGGSEKVIIDAVAHEPEVTEYGVDYGNGREAAEPGDNVTIKAKVEFTNLDAEENFVLVQFAPGWEINGITLIGPDGTTITYSPEELANMELFYPDGNGDGGAYYKLPLEKDDVKIDPGAGEGGKYEVGVEVEVKVPGSGINGDVSGNVGVGGAAVDSYGDGETSLSNNVGSNTSNTDSNGNGINIGVVDTEGIEAGQNDGPAGEGTGSIGITIDTVGGNNDVITKLVLTVSDPDAGEFWYDGVRMEYDADGKVILPPNGAQDGWVFDSDKLEFRPDANFGGNVNVKVEATVEDSKSGASKDGFETEMVIEVEPEATAPTDLTVHSETSDNTWILTLTASFADTDGSEEHFFLFTIPDGLTLDGDYPGLERAEGPDGKEYWKMRVDPNDPNPSLKLRFTQNEDWNGEGEVEYHAGATENGETAWADTTDGNVVAPISDEDLPLHDVAMSSAMGFSPEDALHIFGNEDVDYLAAVKGNIELPENVSQLHDDANSINPEYPNAWNFEDTLHYSDLLDDSSKPASMDDVLGPLVAEGNEEGTISPASLEEDAGLLTASGGNNATTDADSGDHAQATEMDCSNTVSQFAMFDYTDNSAEVMKNLIGQGLV